MFSLFTEGGKSGHLVFIVLLTIFIFVELRKNTKYLTLVLVLFYLSMFVVYNTSEIVQKRFTKEISIFNKQSTTRSLLFTHSLDIIKKNPIIGHGTGSFSDIFRKINKKTQKIVRYNHKTPHNNYLYVWIETGILGLIILLFYFFIFRLEN